MKSKIIKILLYLFAIILIIVGGFGATCGGIFIISYLDTITGAVTLFFVGLIFGGFKILQYQRKDKNNTKVIMYTLLLMTVGVLMSLGLTYSLLNINFGA